ncbi:hypothetical protein VPH35_112430 [Triticum aestivum]
MSRCHSMHVDIICDIGECLLDSNGHDSYVAMRYVCSFWRHAISSNQRLFEINEFSDCTRYHVLVNLSTGQMVKLSKNELYLVKLWELSTGYLVQFAVGIIHYVPRLFYAPGGVYSHRVMCCDRVATMTAYKSDVFVLYHNHRLFKITGTRLAPSAITQYLVVSGGGKLLLMVIGIEDILIFGVDFDQALFLSHARCIAVNAENFPTVRENCVYQACIYGHSGPCGVYEFSLTRPLKRNIYHQALLNDITCSLRGRPLSM